MLPNWIRQVRDSLMGKSRSNPKRSPRRRRFHLETLESRINPVTFTIPGTTGPDAVTLVSFDSGTGDLTYVLNGTPVTIPSFNPAADDVQVLAGAGNDTLTVGPAWNYDVTVSYNGEAGTDTLEASDTTNTFSLTGAGAGTLLATGGTNSVAYTQAESLTGGTAADTFAFGPTGSVGSIDGGLGTDALNYAARGAAVSVNLQTATATGITNPFAGIEALVGSALADTLTGQNVTNDWTVSGPNSGDVNDVFTFSAFDALIGGTLGDTFTYQVSGSVTSLNGGTGQNELVGPNSPNTWTISGVNSGNLNGDLFTNIQTLTGGTAADTFAFGPTGSVGSIDGGLGTDALNYAARGAAVSVNLQTSTAPGITNPFAGIEALVGSALADTLIGRNVANTWSVSGPNSGDVNGFTFSAVENLSGGTLADTFSIGALGTIVSINGQVGANTLDYSLHGTGVSVNLQTSVATGVGTFTNIGNLVGSAAIDSLTGRNVANDWSSAVQFGGNVNGFTFSAIEGLVGGTAVDTFALTDAGAFLSINGGNNNDSLLADFLNARTTAITNVESITVIDTLTGTGTFVWSGAPTPAWSIAGVSYGSPVRVQGETGADTFNINVNLPATRFVLGGAGDDTINVGTGVVVAAGGDRIDGEGGSDVLVFTSSVQVFVNGISGDGYALGVGAPADTFVGINNVRANAASGDTLFGANVQSTWTLTTSPATTSYNGGGTDLLFDGFNTLQGGTATDSFLFEGPYSDSANVNGGAGPDTFNVDFGFPLTTNTRLNGEAGFDSLTYTANVTVKVTSPTPGGGSTGTDGGLTGGFTGMEDFDTGTFLPLDTDNVIRLTSVSRPSGGTQLRALYFVATDLTDPYASIPKLDVPGGAGNDRFELIADAAFKVYGAGGNDALDFTQFNEAQDVRLDSIPISLPTNVNPGVGYAGTAFGQGTQFRDVSRLVGKSGMVNQLTGLGVTSSWEVTASVGSYTGGTTTSLDFQAFNQLHGNVAVDRLAVTDGTSNVWDVTADSNGSLSLSGLTDYLFTSMQDLVGGPSEDLFRIDEEGLIDSIVGFDPIFGNVDPTRSPDQVLYTPQVDTEEQILVELETYRANGIAQFAAIDQFIAQADQTRVVVLAHREADQRLTVVATPTSVTVPLVDPITHQVVRDLDGNVVTETIEFLVQTGTERIQGWDFRTNPDFKTQFKMSSDVPFRNIFFSTPKPEVGDLADQFDYSGYFGPNDGANAALPGITVNLQTGTADGISGLFTYKPELAQDAPNYPGLGLGQLIGSSRMDTLRGRNRATSWKSDPAREYGGPNAGDLTWDKAAEVADGVPLPPDLVGLLVQFRSIESLIGGDLNDTFTLVGDTYFSGTIDGGGSTNVLDLLGSAEDNTITLRPTAVGAGGGQTTFAQIQAVRLNGRGGDDQITIGYAGLGTNYTSIQLIGGDGFDALTVEGGPGSVVRRSRAGRPIASGVKFQLGLGNLLTKFATGFDTRPRFANVLKYKAYQILFDSTERLEIRGGRTNDQFDVPVKSLTGRFTPRDLDGNIPKEVDEITRQPTNENWSAVANLTEVKYVSGGGSDLVRMYPSITTRYVIVGAGRAGPGYLGTGVYLFGLGGAVFARPVLVASEGHDVLYTFRNRQPIQLIGVSRGLGGRIDARPVALRSTIPLLF